MRVLTITHLVPTAVRPLLGPYNLQQVAALSQLCDVDIVAPIPWFPGARFLARWTASGRTISVPGEDHCHGLRVRHPRTVYVPRVPALSMPLFAASLAPRLVRYRGKVDVVYSAWAYPDGCASVALARMLGVPAVVKVHGSDVNVMGQARQSRPYLRRLLPRAARVVVVSRALGQRVIDLGVDPGRVAVVYNGVDSALFQVRDRAAARAALGLPRDCRIILYVGNVLETKGVLDLNAAFEIVSAARPGAMLVIVGEGTARGACATMAGRMGARMRTVGERPREEIGQWMAACDVLTLPSWNEGTPNVILEAHACGRRAVATSVGGVPDLITSELLGELVPVRQPELLAQALIRAVDRDYDPAEVAAQGARGGWAENAARLHQVLHEAVAQSQGNAPR
jgi:glycosyltransferase involved in cell wall biosynthesis